jgi:RNA polymerase sigma-70 factor (ECF subfamily)
MKKIIKFCSNWTLFYVLLYVKAIDPFEELLHRYRGLMLTLSRKFSRRGLEVDDLLQDAALAVWRAREQLYSMKTRGQEAAMVWKIARNAMIDTVRQTRETEELSENYETEAEDNSLLNELYEQINLLVEPDKTIIKLQLEGYNYKEIANKTNLTEKNVSVKLVRIKEKLRTHFIK